MCVFFLEIFIDACTFIFRNDLSLKIESVIEKTRFGFKNVSDFQKKIDSALNFLLLRI